jgi:hypothetical protein
MRGHRWAGLLSLPHGIVWQTYVPGVSERRSLSDGDASLQHVCGATYARMAQSGITENNSLVAE